MGLFSDWYNTFKNNKEGFSGRKLSAFWAIVVIASFLSVKNATPENAVQLVGLWLVFGLLCLGLVTIPDLIKTITELKNSKIQ